LRTEGKAVVLGACSFILGESPDGRNAEANDSAEP
jgi:hypothetical protein